MLLTRNAIGNLINRYRAVLKKCSLLNTFGSLAVVSLLTAGSAGMAFAADIVIDSQSDWDNADFSTVTATEKVTVDSEIDNTTATSIAGSLEINSSLRVADGSSLTAGSVQVGSGSEATLVVNPTGSLSSKEITVKRAGNLSFANEAVYQKTRAGSKIILGGDDAGTGSDLGKLEVGDSRAGGNDNARVSFAQSDFAIGTTAEAGKIQMKDNGRIRIKGTADLTGSALQLSQNSGYKRSVDAFTTEATIKSDNLNIASSNFGFSTGKLYVTGITGSTMNIGNGSGTLTLKDASLRLGDSNPVKGGTVNGNIVFDSGSASELNAASGDWTISGNVTVDGSSDTLLSQLTVGEESDSGVGEGLYASLAINGSNGLTVKKGGVSVGERGKLNVARALSVGAEGSVEVAGEASVGSLVNAGEVKITGNVAATNLDNSKTINISGHDKTLAIGSGSVKNTGTVSITNDAVMTLASAAQLKELAKGKVSVGGGSSSKSYSNIKVNGDLSIGGTDGVSVAASETTGKVAILGNGSLDADYITINDSSLSLASKNEEDSRIRAESKMTFGMATDGLLDVDHAKLTINARNTVGELNGGNVTLGDNAEMRFGHSDDDGKGGSINANITINHATANAEIEGGAWELSPGQTIAVNDGYLSISSQGNATTASLDASAGTLTSKKEGAFGSENTGIIVSENGTLTVSKANVATLIDSTAKGPEIKKILVENGGLLKVSGYGDVPIDEAKNISNKLRTDTSDGHVELLGANITGELSDAPSSAGDSGLMLSGKTVTADKNGINGGYGAGDVQITNADKDLDNVTIKGNLTLEGNNGKLITATGSDGKAYGIDKITLGRDRDNGDVALNLGTVDSAKGGTLNSNVEMGHDRSSLNVTRGNYKVKDITGDKGTVTATDGGTLTAGKIAVGSVDVANGTINAGDVKVTQLGATFTNGAQANLDSLTIGENSDGGVTVGNSDDVKGGTTVTIKKMSLGGKKLLIDPPFAPGINSSVVAVAGLTQNNEMTTDGDIGIGQNSMLALGTRDVNWLESVVREATNGAGLTENGVTAALAIYKPLTIGQDGQQSLKILVDGSLDNDGLDNQLGPKPAGNIKDVTFEENSLLVINGKEINGNKVAISGENPLTGDVAPNSKLHIVNAKVKKTYQVFANGSTITGLDPDDTGWTGENVTTDDMMVAIARDTTSKLGVYKTSLVGAKKVMPDIDSELAGLIDAGYLNDKLGGDRAYTGKGGQKFLTRLTHRDFMRGGRDAARVVEGAARIISIGGVQQMALAANNAAGGAVVNRTSIGSLNTGLISVDSQGKVQEKTEGEMSGANAGDTMTGANAGGFNRSGFGMWIMPLWQSVNHFGLKGGDFKADLNGSLGGVALGADYTIDDMVRLGLTFNIGGGYSQGSGDFATTKNNMNFWGIGAYASYAQNNMGLTFDINYTSTFNKLKQEMDSRMAMGDLKTDLFAQVLTLGLRGEYKFQLDALDILPHVAVRYTNLWTDDYDVKSNRDKIMKGDGSNQSIWTFPIGIQFSKDIMTSNNWYVRPSLDLSVIPAAGDIEARNDIRFTGVSGEAGLKTQVMDYISYAGQAGIEFGNENIKVGVNYNLQVGAHTTNHGVFGTFRYEF